MNISFIPSSKTYLQNNYFDKNFSRDRVLEPHFHLREHFKRKNIDIDTYDVAKKPIDIIVLTRLDFNLGTFLYLKKKNPLAKVIYIVTEERTVCPLHIRDLLDNELFDVVLTWNEDMIDEVRYLRYFYPNPIREMLEPKLFNQKRLVAMVNGYKLGRANKAGEGYSTRRELVTAFLQKDFSLYGSNWGAAKIDGIQNVYKGACKDKIETLSNFKFTIAFENTLNEKGAITEKIFDCFAAGTVPIYYGWDEVSKYIPKDCYIDFRDFMDFDKLYKFISSISESEYNIKLKKIKLFLLSRSYEKFTSMGYINSFESAIRGLDLSERPENSMNDLIWKLRWSSIKNLWSLRKSRRYWRDLIFN